MKNCMVLLRVLWFLSPFWAGTFALTSSTVCAFASKIRTGLRFGQLARCFGSMTQESR